MSKGITITEECHVVNLVPPVNIDTGGGFDEAVHLGNYAHCTFVCSSGAITNATTLTVAACTDSGGTSPTALDFKYSREVTGSSDVFSALTWKGDTSGIATGTQDGSTHVIEIDASELPDGKPWLELSASNPGADHFMGVIAILSGSRYAGAVTPSAQ